MTGETSNEEVTVYECVCVCVCVFVCLCILRTDRIPAGTSDQLLIF